MNRFKTLILLPALLLSFAANAATLKKVEVLGAERIEPSTVLSYLTANIGDDVTDQTITDSTKALYATGLFSDVALKMTGSTLQVQVTENALINQVAFEGNNKIKSENLQAEIKSMARAVLSRTTVLKDVDRMKELYRRQGRFSAKIEPKIINLDQNRVNLVFEIDEGELSTIQGVKFVGNEAFTDGELREVVSSREDKWYRILTTADRYDPDRISYDEDLLRRHYMRHGFVDFHILSAISQLTEDKSNFYITFTLEEGPQYRVSSVSVDPAALEDGKEIDFSKDMMVEVGEIYNADTVQDTIGRMTGTLTKYQQNFVAIEPEIKKDAEGKNTLALVFRTQETPKVFVERINIRGNTRTQDKVIRREFQLAEGDAYNRTRLAASEQGVKDLNFFEKVTVDPRPGSTPDQAVIDVDVEEKSTGELSVAGGFSTEDGPLADFGVRERNFLGKGQTLKLSTTLSGKRTEFDISLTEPQFLDRNLAATVDAFHITRNLQSESSYDQRKSGGGVRFGYPLSSNWSQSVGYRLQNNEIDNVKSTASRYVADQAGSRVTSAISQRLVYDTRDSTLIPTDGVYSWFDTEAAGLGGDAKYISAKLGGVRYFPLNVDKDYIFSILGETGAIQGIGDDVRINERYYLGGNTLRGFRYSGLGPRDTTTSDALGGNFFYRTSAELTMPSGLPEDYGVQTHLFTDAGSLWDVDETGTDIADENSIRVGAGAGVSWKSPAGPIRLDFSSALSKESYDETESFRFNFGTSF